MSQTKMIFKWNNMYWCIFTKDGIRDTFIFHMKYVQVCIESPLDLHVYMMFGDFVIITKCPYIMYMWRSLISMSIHHVHVKVLTFHAHTSCNMWRSLLSMPIHHVHVKVLTFNAHTSCTCEGPYFQFIHAHTSQNLVIISYATVPIVG